ncbi:hypothetical protein N7G274_000711 [Stereocaulon virgatum]|uniref:Uncharacterized protein n=1 Tax=Stereocaulon virgatum TaxID=373712 RepID=A0ABR4APJ8_9LECA
MTQRLRLLLRLISFFIFITAASAYSPTSFCKCTCFTNSTIIPLDAPKTAAPRTEPLISLRIPEHDEVEEPLPEDPAQPSSTPTPKPDKGKGNGEDGDRKEYRAGNCNDCNRQFCLDYNLPICKGAAVEDVFTTCFQRDSRKDEAVVFIFIFATAGLLIWAAAKPWIGKWVESARDRTSYIPVSSQGDS